MIFPSCREVARLECLALDRPLTTGEKLKLRLHRLICWCPMCCGHQKQLDAFEQAIDHYKHSLESCRPEHRRRLCEEARERICCKLRDVEKADSE